jgi:hypothetical protein
VLRKIFVIRIVTKDFKLTFNHFNPVYFLDLERRRGKRRIGGMGARNKGWYFLFE